MDKGLASARHWKYEHRTEPLASRAAFARRVLVHGFVGSGIIAVSLAIGVIGYRATEGLPWIDAFLNAAMILGGMGEVWELRTTAGKVFAATYALFSGVAFLAVVGVMFAPLAHRLLHGLHMEKTPER